MFFDFFNSVFNLFLIWWPWFNFLDEIYLIQFSLIYLFWVFYNSKNVYYSLFYLFLIIFFLGLSISFIQMELFTGFLWVTEFTVILIILILFFYLNVEGQISKINLKYSNFYYIFFFLFVYFFIFFRYLPFCSDYSNADTFIFDYLYEDWYESISNNLMNDFLVLTIGYYSINSLEFILIGFLLLIGSVVCVVLNKIQKNVKISNSFSFLNLFSFFTDYLNFSFLRKQDLNNQAVSTSTIRLFKKKKW